MTYVPIEESDKMPMGAIIMWSGLDTEIPTGWHICDGTNGTPDLRDKFVVGAGSSYAKGDTGGEASHTLTVAEMPQHQHSYYGDIAGSGAASPFNYPLMASDADATRYVNSAGGDEPHNNMPPYYALYYIMKVG